MIQTELMVKLVLDRWNASLKNCDNLLSTLNDDSLLNQIAPGKNRGIYLLGHLIAVHDDMFILLAMGQKLYPEYYEPFLKHAYQTTDNLPTISTLRNCWTNQCEVLHQKFAALQPDQWFEKHMAVSAEDFTAEPHRNKLNIVITRTSHLQYHLGQFTLLK